MKYYGMLGFENTQEIRPSFYDEQPIERPYYGEIYRKTRQLNDSGYVNGEIGYQLELSILADPYLRNHMDTLRYVTLDTKENSTKWTVTSVDPTTYPRMTLSIGGVYNDGIHS